MFLHPDLQLLEMRQREHDMIAKADRHRLLSAARRARQAAAEARPTPRNRSDGNLAACGPRVAAPAR